MTSTVYDLLNASLSEAQFQREVVRLAESRTQQKYKKSQMFSLLRSRPVKGGAV